MNNKQRSKMDEQATFSALSKAERQYVEYLKITSVGVAHIEAGSAENQTGYSPDWSHPMGLVINK